MKIKRFIESASVTALNNVIYDIPWTKEKFQELSELKSEIKATEESLFSALDTYLKLHPDLLEENEKEFYIKSFDYDTNQYRRLIIEYYDGENDVFETSLNSKEFEDFLEFLKDPDLYKNSKKYNL